MPTLATLRYGGLVACKQEGLQSCLDAFESRAARVTPEGLLDCSNRYRERTCEAFLGRDEIPQECHLEGTRGDGESCTTGFDCADGCCSLSEDSSCPVCVASEPAGKPCKTHQGCNHGLLCSDAGFCAEQSDEGEACGEERPCRQTLFCNEKKVCAPLGIKGAPCNKQDGSGCDSFHGYFCQPFTGLCESLAFARIGEPCGYLDGPKGAYTYCILGSACELDPSNPQAIHGICGALLPAGSPCVWDELPTCAPPAYCLAKVCTVPGESCKAP